VTVRPRQEELLEDSFEESAAADAVEAYLGGQITAHSLDEIGLLTLSV
jgi:hypothetical protein